MILPYQILLARHAELIPDERDRNPEHVNPASIDIRVGRTLTWRENEHDLLNFFSKEVPFKLEPGEFALVATFERLVVPNDLVMELRLKSSRAREGWNHALAFWFDPGWDGIGTMELQNISHKPLPLYTGLKIAQLIYHQLLEPCAKPYAGKYQGAKTVEMVKRNRLAEEAWIEEAKRYAAVELNFSGVQMANVDWHLLWHDHGKENRSPKEALDIEASCL